LQRLESRRVDLEGEEGNGLVPPHDRRMRRGQTREDAVLRATDGTSPLGPVTGLRDLKGDEHPGPPDAHEGADLGLDTGLSLRYAGGEGEAGHDVGNEERGDTGAHPCH